MEALCCVIHKGSTTEIYELHSPKRSSHTPLLEYRFHFPLRISFLGPSLPVTTCSVHPNRLLSLCVTFQPTDPPSSQIASSSSHSKVLTTTTSWTVFVFLPSACFQAANIQWKHFRRLLYPPSKTQTKEMLYPSSRTTASCYSSHTIEVWKRRGLWLFMLQEVKYLVKSCTVHHTTMLTIMSITRH